MESSTKRRGEEKYPHILKRMKANWIGLIFRRKCLLKHATEGKIEGRIDVTGRRGRIHKQLLDDLKKNKRILEI